MKKTLLFVVALLPACAANGLTPAARQVRLLQSEPASCEYVGEVVGNQGNFFTGDFTSNKNLEAGALNDMKNRAARMGANRIVLMTNRAGNTGSWSKSGGSQRQTNVTMMATAYRCDERAATATNEEVEVVEEGAR